MRADFREIGVWISGFIVYSEPYVIYYVYVFMFSHSVISEGGTLTSLSFSFLVHNNNANLRGWASQVVLVVKIHLLMQETQDTQVQSLGREDPLR